jgi:hypothetical protein
MVVSAQKVYCDHFLSGTAYTTMKLRENSLLLASVDTIAAKFLEYSKSIINRSLGMSWKSLGIRHEIENKEARTEILLVAEGWYEKLLQIEFTYSRY